MRNVVVGAVLAYTLGRKGYNRLAPANYVFQGGTARTPTQSVTGGGNVPQRQIISKFRPVIMARTIFSTGVQGNMPSNPFTTAPLSNSPEIQGGNSASTTSNGVS